MGKSTLSGWLQVLCVVGLAVGACVSTSRGQGLEWRSFEEAMATADSTDRFVMVAVYAPWCGWCRKMKSDVYPSAGVRQCLAENFVVTRLNRDDTETTYQYQGCRMTPRMLASRFRADGVPTTVVLSPEGRYVLHLSGYIEPNRLRAVLAYVSTGAHRHEPLSDFRSDPGDCGDGTRKQSD